MRSQHDEDEDPEDMEMPCPCPGCGRWVELNAMRELRLWDRAPKMVCAGCYEGKMFELRENEAPNRI